VNLHGGGVPITLPARYSTKLKQGRLDLLTTPRWELERASKQVPSKFWHGHEPSPKLLHKPISTPVVIATPTTPQTTFNIPRIQQHENPFYNSAQFAAAS